MDWRYLHPRRGESWKPGEFELVNRLKLPAHVLFRKDLSLILWRPRGILDESAVNEMVEFVDVC